MITAVFRSHLFLCFVVVLFAGQLLAADPETSEKDEKPEGPTATAIKGTAEIDGKPDKAWKKAPRVKVKKPVEDLLSIDEEKMATGTAQFMWDKDMLYVFWKIKDSQLSAVEGNPWDQDSVELFIDQNKKGSYSYEEDDAQYRTNFRGEISGQGKGYNEELLKVAAVKTKRGYIVEMALKIEHVELKPGAKLGLELQINDDTGEGTRAAVIKWNHTEDDSWEDTSNFGTLVLK